MLSEYVECYLKGVKEQLTVHSDFPAQALKRMRHPNKDDVVDAKHQNQDKGGFGQFPVRCTHGQKSIDNLKSSQTGQKFVNYSNQISINLLAY